MTILPLFLFFFFLPPPSLSQQPPPPPPPSSSSCPLNFTILYTLTGTGNTPTSYSAASGTTVTNTKCQFIRQSFRLLQSDLLRRTDNFMPPLSASLSCWSNFQSYINSFDPTFHIQSSCGFSNASISQGCVNITTRQRFESLVSSSVLQNVDTSCNQSLENNSPCALCTTSLSSLPASGKSLGNLSDCTSLPSVYAAAFSNAFGPSNPGTAKCLFSLDFTPLGDSNNKKNKKKIVVSVVVTFICVSGLVFVVLGLWKLNEKLSGKNVSVAEMGLVSSSSVMGLDYSSMDQSTTLIRFSIEDIKKATKNFSRDNIIGRGGYGNVYKGLLNDGTEVALKRFKNCSAAGDSSFKHEVEVIASVRHVNLVALRGYCSATTNLEGYQRIIVCDLMKNGSLHDHLFGGGSSSSIGLNNKLSWPIRQKIALGTARGIAYLHYGAQPSIIHRDIKASNILLDEKFEAKVADFGLAKFNPEGMTHMSTRVAGTMGYVAPEYALYGQLTERSDVFSFGVVLLELLSGKKALSMSNDGQPSALTDWAWSMVRTNKALDVIEDGMPELGSPKILEKYVLIGVLCSHPQLYARPTMDQVVKMMETDQDVEDNEENMVPAIPDRPIPLVARRIDIERSASSSGGGGSGGSGGLSSPTGYQAYTIGSDKHSSNNSKEDGSSSSKILSIEE
ncbi:probable LRR receptor-like serine/threonine-protein kinase RKF3 [Arachis stenosperma]|uniref:probable LRR receptor-like serine/threonine-protein kinase RKF3 n=1 Tax=Arachis stenosperma TaxID=217475 RepID=UPI0025AC9166|nr:probable LRR receptor-like serine/threonine-protein kinase RKF3 [Arachis stenosperma]